MVNATGVITLEQLAQDFTSLFRRRVFRLETLDYYDAANEREPYAAFLAGQPVDPAWRGPWQGLVRGVRESGRTMERVHIVSEPVTDYIRFSLLHGYPASVEAGEEVRILGLAAASDAGLGRDDFWLFDDDLAALLAYDGDGRAERVSLTNEPGKLALLRATRDRAFWLARPLARYVADNKITGERNPCNMSTKWDGAQFRKADDSNDVGCVEVAFHGGKIGVRDSKDHGTGPVLGFTEHEWECFIQGAKNGEFDLPGNAG